MDNQCVGHTKTGQPCKGTVLDGKRYCFAHDPELADRRKQGSIQGGHGKSNRARARKGLTGEAMTMREVGGLLSRALRRVDAGQMEPGIATSMATVARALVAIQETGQLEERLAALEARVGVEPDNVSAFPRRMA